MPKLSSFEISQTIPQKSRRTQEDVRLSLRSFDSQASIVERLSQLFIVCSIVYCLLALPEQLSQLFYNRVAGMLAGFR